MNTIFAFDFDGTLTMRETLPELAKELGRADEFAAITKNTVAGNIPFVESFAARVAVLSAIPLTRARAIMAAIPLNDDIVAFVKERSANCVVVTGNLDLWVAPVIRRLGCAFFSSAGVVEEEGGIRITRYVDKAAVIEKLRQKGAYVVAVGDGAGDLAMLNAADFAVAYAGVHEPPAALIRIADFVAPDGRTLCRRLKEFL